MEDLLELEAAGERPIPCQPELRRVISPLATKLQQWRRYLDLHPDRRFAEFILRGLGSGFRIGCAVGVEDPVSGGKNMKSAVQNPQVVSEYLDAELRAGRIVEVEVDNSAGVRASPFGVIPKQSQPGKWRLINDLSSPAGASINDRIARDSCSIRYASVDTAASLVLGQGRGALMAKLDLRHAYRVVPVHPADRLLLGMRWHGRLYVDTALPFGLRSAPKIFSAVADALLWAMHCRGMRNAIHYLDDFFFVGPPGSLACAVALQVALAACDELGMPVAVEKLVGPTTRIVFLGIELDSMSMQIRLPDEKLCNLKTLIAKWSWKSSATKKEVQSLVGHFQHAATVVKPGRTFLRHLIDLAASVKAQHHRVHLRSRAMSDMHWWKMFLVRWNGCSVIPPSSPSESVVSDASGSWGCGACWGHRWLQLQWPAEARWSRTSIAVKELVPVVLAVAMWGSQWASCRVLVRCDNTAVVAAVNVGSVRDPHLMQLLRCLHFFCAVYGVTVSASHIQGAKNGIADAISRNHMSMFHTLVPQAPAQPAILPSSLRRLLLDTPISWTSGRWRQLFHSSLEEVLPPQRPVHMGRGQKDT